MGSLLVTGCFKLTRRCIYPKGNTTRLVGCLISRLANYLNIICPAFRRCPGHVRRSGIVTCIPRGGSFSCATSSLVTFFTIHRITTVLLVGPSGPSKGCVSGISMIRLTG